MQTDNSKLTNEKQSICFGEKIEIFYHQILLQWMKFYENQSDSMNNNGKVQANFYSKVFKPKLVKITKLNILFDKRILDAMDSLLTQLDYIKINKSPLIDENGKLQNADKIQKIAEELSYNNFITKGMLKKIKNKTHSQNSLQVILDKLLAQIKLQKLNSTNKIQLMTVWASFFGKYKFEDVWNKLIVKNKCKLNQKTINSIYTHYKILLHQHQNIKFSVNVELAIQNNVSIQSRLLHYSLIDDLTFATSHKYIEIFDKQRSQLQLYIRNAVKSSYIGQNIQLSFEIFGSSRNGFHLKNSDFDITVFCKQNVLNYALYKVMNVLEHYFSQLVGTYVKKLQLIAKAKVPVFKLQLNNLIVQNIDIVLNNAHGVENSKFLYKYASNLQIKRFGILIKKWAKAFDLIGPQKFSSYGFIYMALFYLIKVEKIEPAQRLIILKKQKQSQVGQEKEKQKAKYKIKPQINLKSQINLETDFINFLKFYGKGGQYEQNKQFVCILSRQKQQQRSKQQNNLYACSYTHMKINRQNYLVNIHDPFDDSNSGRCNIQNSNEFYNAIDETLRILNSKDSTKILKMLNKQCYSF